LRKRVIFWMTFIGGIYFFLEFMLPAEIWLPQSLLTWLKGDGTGPLARNMLGDRGFIFGGLHEDISNGAILTGVMALGLGLINIMRIHGVRLAKLRKGWVHSAGLIAGMLITIFVGFWHWKSPGSTPGRIWGDVIMGTKGLFPGLSSAMFSLLAFYVATAAYRAFRIKSGEAALLMFSALLVMLGQIPHGVVFFDAIFSHGPFRDVSIVDIRMWILKKLNVGAFRAISLGFGVAGLAMATRMWLSMGMGSFFQDEEEK